jgi:hypothetical protein
MISGAVVTAFAMLNLVWYLRGKEFTPLLGRIPMAFGAAACFVILGLAVFWVGWLIQDQAKLAGQAFSPSPFTSHQYLELALAIISAASLVATALIGALAK